MILRQAGRQIASNHLVMEGVAVRPRSHDKGRGSTAKVIHVGAVTDNGCCPGLKGEGQDVTGVFLEVDTIKENAGVGHCLIAVFTEGSREGSERGFPESINGWWGGS